MRTSRSSTPAVVVAATFVTATLVAGCSLVTPTVAPPSPSPSPAASPVAVSPSPEVLVLEVGSMVVTVHDGLRVRSQPRVSDDSYSYQPPLPLGTQLEVLEGPVEASGFTWYRVAPVWSMLEEGVTDGWIPVASQDGRPWIARVGPAASP